VSEDVIINEKSDLIQVISAPETDDGCWFEAEISVGLQG
jgi:hypothetical protein